MSPEPSSQGRGQEKHTWWSVVKTTKKRNSNNQLRDQLLPTNVPERETPGHRPSGDTAAHSIPWAMNGAQSEEKQSRKWPGRHARGSAPPMCLSSLRCVCFSSVLAACLSRPAKAPAQPRAPGLPLLTGSVRCPSHPGPSGDVWLALLYVLQIQPGERFKPSEQTLYVWAVAGHVGWVCGMWLGVWTGQGALPHSLPLSYSPGPCRRSRGECPLLLGKDAPNYNRIDLLCHGLFSPNAHNLSRSAHSNRWKIYLIDGMRRWH